MLHIRHETFTELKQKESFLFIPWGHIDIADVKASVRCGMHIRRDIFMYFTKNNRERLLLLLKEENQE